MKTSRNQSQNPLFFKLVNVCVNNNSFIYFLLHYYSVSIYSCLSFCLDSNFLFTKLQFILFHSINPYEIFAEPSCIKNVGITLHISLRSSFGNWLDIWPGAIFIFTIFIFIKKKTNACRWLMKIQSSNDVYIRCSKKSPHEFETK